MVDQRDTGISWTDETWNPVVGCSVVSPACTNCYAMAMASRIERMSGGNTHYAGTTKVVNGKPVWTGKLALAPDHIVIAPLRWKRPRRVFVNSMSDLFHEDMPESWIDRIFALMSLRPQHTFQILTKRPDRMRHYFEARRDGDPWAEAADEIADLMGWESHAVVLEPQHLPLPNVWLGVTAEDQARADERIPHLLATPAAVRFVSAEPLLGPIDFRDIGNDGWSAVDALRPYTVAEAKADWGDDFYEECGLESDQPALDLIIAGGESGPGARPTHPDWVRSIRDQCEAADVAFHFKQWGEWAPICNLADGEADTLYRSNRVAEEGEDQLALDEIYGRTCKVPVEHLGYGGAKCLDAFFAVEGKGGMTFFRLGKARAGRALDGQIHDAFPEAP